VQTGSKTLKVLGKNPQFPGKENRRVETEIEICLKPGDSPDFWIRRKKGEKIFSRKSPTKKIRKNPLFNWKSLKLNGTSSRIDSQLKI